MKLNNLQKNLNYDKSQSNQYIRGGITIIPNEMK